MIEEGMRSDLVLISIEKSEANEFQEEQAASLVHANQLLFVNITD